MHTRRTQPATPRTLPARESFESPALYDLVATLAIESYADLLAPHWTSPDRPAAHERLERERFTRRRSISFARTAMTLHADGSRLVARGRRRNERAVPLHDVSAWLIAAGEHDVVAKAEPHKSPRASRRPFEWLHVAVAAWIAWLRRLLTRSRR